MPFTIRRPIQIELDRQQEQDAAERKRDRLTEEMKKFREEALRRADQKAEQQTPDLRSRILERAEELREEREGPAPQPTPRGGGGFLGGLADIGRGALDVGRGIVGGIDRGLEAIAPAAGRAAEAGVRGQPIGQVAELVRAIPGVPTTGGGPTITDVARKPFVPGAAQIGQAVQSTFESPLAAAEAEVEFGRAITEPVGRALGRAAVAGTPALAVADVATRGKLSDIAADIGGVVGPELAVLSNAVPVEAALFAGPKILFRATKVTPKVLETLARVAKGGATIDTLEAGVKTDLAKFADEAVEAVELRPVVSEPPERLTERFGLPAEQITTETRIPPGVSREAPLTGQQAADLPVGQAELPFPRTRNAQEIAQLAGERRNNLRAVQEGAEAGTNSVDDVLAAEAELAVARQSDAVARAADVEDLTKTSFDELIENARKACRG